MSEQQTLPRTGETMGIRTVTSSSKLWEDLGVVCFFKILSELVSGRGTAAAGGGGGAFDA